MIHRDGVEIRGVEEATVESAVVVKPQASFLIDDSSWVTAASELLKLALAASDFIAPVENCLAVLIAASDTINPMTRATISSTSENPR